MAVAVDRCLVNLLFTSTFSPTVIIQDSVTRHLTADLTKGIRCDSSWLGKNSAAFELLHNAPLI